jgi:hypothetical protein
MKTNRGHRRSRGYVLLVVMAVSILVITVLGTLAKVSLRRALEAADAERSLQQRWGALTLERALLAKAPQTFKLREELAAELAPGKPPPPATIRAVLSLRGVTFDLLLADEDAKLNLNSFYHQLGPDRTKQAVARVAGQQAVAAIRLVPAVEPMNLASLGEPTSFDSDPVEEEPILLDAFRSWGEVFDFKALATLYGSDAALPNVTAGVTCWGSGQLNIRRASDEAILAVAASVVQDGGARRLLKRYRENPIASLSALLQSEVSSQRNRDALANLMSETSTNFSIWIDASSQGRGSIRSFTVMRRDEEGVTRQSKFVH